MELTEFQAALRDHEARVGGMVDRMRAGIEGAPRGEPPSEGIAQRSIAAELSWWSEAVMGQMRELQDIFADGLQKSAAEVRLLQGSVAGLRSGAASAPGAQDSLREELQGIRSDLGALRASLQVDHSSRGRIEGSSSREELLEIRSCVGALPGRLSEQLEHDRRERQAQLAVAFEHDLHERRHSDEGLKRQLEQQGESLKDLSRGLAELQAFLELNGAEKAESRELTKEALAVHEDALATHETHAEALAYGRHRAASEVELALELTSNGSSVKELPPIRQLASDVAHHPCFLILSGVIILFSSIIIGIEADEERRFTDDLSSVFRVLDFIFIAVFIIELAIRWVSAGSMFLNPRSMQFYWNLFDTVLVALSVVEAILWIFSVQANFQFLFLRLARLLRLARMMRMFRAVREFKELRLMVNGVLNCAKPLLWALLLMLALTYMTAVFMVQMTTDYLRKHDREGQLAEFIDDNFSSVLWSMYGLFKCLTSGDDWGKYGDPLYAMSKVGFLAFILYIVLGMFCILNLVTAVFLEAANRTGDLQEDIYAKQDWMLHAREFFGKLIKDVKREKGTRTSSQQIDKDEFVNVLSHATCILFLEEHGLDLFLEGDVRLEQLFNIMDYNKNGLIDIAEFVSGLYLLKGSARALDVRLEHSKITQLLEGLQRSFLRVQASRRSL